MDVQVLYDKLLSFEQPHEIAQYLRSLNIHGNTGKPNSCPLANYFAQGEGVKAASVADSIHVYFDQSEGRKWAKLFPLTYAAKSFIEDFDGGAYEYLEAVQRLRDL